MAGIVSAIGNSMGFLSPMIVAGFVDSNVSILYKPGRVHNFIFFVTKFVKQAYLQTILDFSKQLMHGEMCICLEV